jgi:hypothetical protein
MAGSQSCLTILLQLFIDNQCELVIARIGLFCFSLFVTDRKNRLRSGIGESCIFTRGMVVCSVEQGRTIFG